MVEGSGYGDVDMARSFSRRCDIIPIKKQLEEGLASGLQFEGIQSMVV